MTGYYEDKCLASYYEGNILRDKISPKNFVPSYIFLSTDSRLLFLITSRLFIFILLPSLRVRTFEPSFTYIHMVENLYGCSIGTKSPYKLKPYGQIP